MLVEGIEGVWSRWVGRAWQYVGMLDDHDDIRRVTPAGTFSMVGVDGTTFEGCHRAFHISTLVECVRVDVHLEP